MNAILNKSITIKRYNPLYKGYKNFVKNFSKESVSQNEIKTEFIYLQDRFVKEGQTEAFCANSENLIEQLITNGREKIANILLNELGKLHLRKKHFPLAEKYIIMSLNLSKNFKDNFHVLARLNDLERIYKATGERKKLLGVLHNKKECIKEIINNYDVSVKNYQSIVRPPTSLDAVMVQLAYTYSDISDLLLRRRPQDSLNATVKARNIYQKLGRAKETQYLNVKIERIAQRLQRSKHLDK